MFDPSIMLRQARRQKRIVRFGRGAFRKLLQITLNSTIILSLIITGFTPALVKAASPVDSSVVSNGWDQVATEEMGIQELIQLVSHESYVPDYTPTSQGDLPEGIGFTYWEQNLTYKGSGSWGDNGTTIIDNFTILYDYWYWWPGPGSGQWPSFESRVSFDRKGEVINSMKIEFVLIESTDGYLPNSTWDYEHQPPADILVNPHWIAGEPQGAGTYCVRTYSLLWGLPSSVKHNPRGQEEYGGTWAYKYYVRIIEINGIDVRKPTPDRSTFSSCQSKNGQGDPRECPLTSTRDTQGTAGDPINTRTGGFDYSLVDLSLPTVSGPLLFQRTYSSLATELYTTTLGSGWTHNHDTRLIFPSDPGGEADVVWFKAHTANQYRFDITAPDTFTPYPGVLASLDGDAANGYTLVDAAHNTYAFDGLGRLLSRNDALGHTLTYTYTNNLLSRVSDPTGQRYLGFQYDTSDRLKTVTDNSGRYVRFDYANDNLASFTDALDQTWNYNYNDPNYSHHLSEVIDPRGETAVRTEYDASGRAIHQYDGLDQLTVDITYNPDGSSLIQDGRGYTTTHTYDARNTLVGQVNPLGGTIDKSYTYGFRPATLTDPNGHSTALSWSMDGANLLQAVDADDNLLQMSYDSLNNLTSLIDRRGNETTFTYAGKLLISRTDALEHSTYYTYTTASDWPQPEGLLKTVTDPLGHTTSFSYDALGQMTVMTDTLGHATRYGYDSLGRLELTTDALGRATRYEYDAAGQLLKTTSNYDESYPQNYQDVYNIVTQYAYDPLSNLVAITDTLGQATRYDYDANNRLIKVTDALSHTTGYAYDPNGNLTSKTDANGVVTAYEYDALNRLAAVIENYRPGYTPDMETNVRTKYSYDPAGNLLAIRDARAVLEGRQEVTSFDYNELNRLVSETDPLNHAWSYDYDPEGNLITMTDTLNATTSYIYDPLGRLTAIDYPDPDTGVSFEYNPLGWRMTMTDGLGITTWDYDDLGRIESITDPFSNVVGYSYNAVGNRTGMTYPDLKSVGYQYDALDRLVQVTDWSQGITQYNYDPLSRLEQEVLPNGVASYYGYDALSQVNSLSHETPSGRLASYQYAYDPLGNRTAVTETLTQPLPDLIFSDGFESGNFLGWSGTKTTVPTNLAVTTGAAMYGSYGEKASPVSGRVAFTYDNSPQAEKRYRARFYFDPNNVGLGSFSGNYHTIFKAYNADYIGGSLGTAVVLLEFRKYNTSYQVRAGAYHNSGYTYTGWQTINNAPNAIELEWKAAATPGGSNGYLSWWLNGSAKTGLVNLKNGTLAVESAFLGAVDGVDSGASGWYCFDAFVSRRESYTGTEMSAPRPCGSSLDGGEEMLLPEGVTATTESSSAIVSLTATFEAGEALVGETLVGEILITDTFLLTDTFRISETLDGDPRISDTVVLTDTFWISDVTTLAETYDLLMEQWLTATLEVADPGVGEGMALLAGDSTTRIDYTYDPLGRLTAADYTPQTFFHYTYRCNGKSRG